MFFLVSFCRYYGSIPSIANPIPTIIFVILEMSFFYQDFFYFFTIVVVDIFFYHLLPDNADEFLGSPILFGKESLGLKVSGIKKK